jgi:murein tripeptide amidase MpaA
MKISSNFDSGNIEVVSISDNGEVKLRIRKDTNSDFLQWFHFRLTGEEGQLCRISIINAGETSYPKGWEDYHTCASYDRETWFRTPTEYVDGELRFEIRLENNSVYFAYFAPFTHAQHLDLVHSAQMSGLCELEVIGETVEGRDIELLTIGEPDPEMKNVWVIARQHPGESMAEWFIQGFLGRLLDESDSVSRSILDQAVIYVIPNMNIDGSIAGNLRSNAAGANLNREWESPSLERSPEVYHTLAAMDATGVDLLLDVHGDEELPYNFVAGSEGIPSYDDYLKRLEDKFKAAWMATCPDFQDTHKYDLDEPGKANMTVCTNQIGERFHCLAYTIEMPFKDNADLPDEFYGWSPERSEALGASVLQPLLAVLGDVGEIE